MASIDVTWVFTAKSEHKVGLSGRYDEKALAWTMSTTLDGAEHECRRVAMADDVVVPQEVADMLYRVQVYQQRVDARG